MTTKTSTNHNTSESFVCERVRDWLFSNGWAHKFHKGDLHQQGVDILVQNNQPPHTRYFYIEAKGASFSKNKRGVDDGSVITAIGQIITRMKHGFGPNRYGIAFPESLEGIMVRKLPWRVAQRLQLTVFLVNKDKNKPVVHYTWKELKQLQHKR